MNGRAAGFLKRWLLPLMALCMMGGMLLGRAASGWAWPTAAAAASALALGIAWRHPLPRRISLLALVLCIGSVWGWLSWHPVLPEEGTHHITGVVGEEIRDGSRNQHKTILRDLTVDGKPWRGGAYWSFYAAELPEGLVPGAAIEGDLDLYIPSGADNPGGFDFREYLMQRNCRIGLYGMRNLAILPDRFSLEGSAAALRHSLTEGLCSVMDEETGGYAATMLLGTKNLIDTEDRDAFSRLGIAHVLSVSGFHVGVLFAAVGWLLRRLRTPRWAQFPILTVLLGAYTLLTGLGAPVIRAAILVLLNEWGHLRHRHREPLHLLSAAAMLTLLVQPSQLTAAGFHLSYGAMLGLALVRPWLARHVRPAVRRPLRWAREGLIASLSVQIGILLPQLYWYQSFPLLSLFLNMFVLVIASGVLMIYWAVLLLMGVPGLGWLLGQAAAALTHWLTAGVRFLGSHDWISVWTCRANLWTAVGWLLLLIGLGWLWSLRKRFRFALAAAGAAAVILSVIAWPQAGITYVQLSVGNADAAVLQDEGTVWVIDTGEDSTLATYLHQRRLSVDTLVLSHLHSDHAGGLEDLVRSRIPVRRIILPEGAERQAVDPGITDTLAVLRESGTEIVYAGRGDRFPLPSGDAAVLWPVHGAVRSGQDANSYSLALCIRVDGVTLLTCGDLTSAYEAAAAVPADILKVAHHGSASSTGEAYLRAVDPSVLLLSNRLQSREDRVLALADGIPVYSTLRHGAVTLVFSEGSWRCIPFLSAPVTP